MLSRLLRIGDQEESRKIGLLFAYLFFVVSASTIGRTAADTLFLSRFDSSVLSKMYLPQSAALILIGYLYQRFASRLATDKLIRILIPLITLLVLGSRAGVATGADWILPVIYVAFDVFNFLMIVCFWQLATAVLDQRKAKRTIGLVGSGGIVGGIASGFGLKLLVAYVGTADLMYFYAGLQLSALVVVMILIRGKSNPVTPSSVPTAASLGTLRSDQRKPSSSSGLFANVPHLKYLAVMSAALVISLTFIDYQFKMILRETLQNEALAGFMGNFYGFAGLAALCVQLFVAGKLLSKFGVMTAILVFPVALLAGSFGLLLAPVLAMSTVVKASDKVLGDTLHTSVNQLVMLPIPAEWRSRAKGFLDGVVRNGAKGAAGLGLIALSPVLSVRSFSFVIIGLIICCVLAAIKVKSAYLAALLSALKTKGHQDLDQVELDLMDPATLAVLTEALQAKDKHQVRYAMRILSGVDGFEFTPYMPSLLHHDSMEVVIAALEQVERSPLPGLEDQLLQLVSVSKGIVKSHVLLALSAFSDERHLDEISRHLEAEDREGSAGAIAGLIKYYGIEGMFRAVGTLKLLLESQDEADRIRVASLFGLIGIKSFYKPLIPLLQDRSPKVRRGALQSAAQLQVPELAAFILPLLGDNTLRNDAIEALGAYDERVILPLLSSAFTDGSASLHLPKVFERVGTQAALDLLLEAYASASLEMRDKLLETLTRMTRTGLLAPRDQAENAIELEKRWLDQLTAHMSGLEAKQGYREVTEAAEQLKQAAIQRIFHWLTLLFDPGTIQAVYVNWSEGNAGQQANATEAMDQLLQGRLRMLILSLMEPVTASISAQLQSEGQDHLDWLAEQGDEWLRLTVSHVRGDPGAADVSSLNEHMERIALLAAYPLFQELTHRDLSAFASVMETIEAKQGDVVFRMHEPGDSLYFVRSGVMGIYRDGVKIDERLAGDSFGQTAILLNRPRTATLAAEADATLWRLDSASLYGILFDRTQTALALMKVLSRRLRSAIDQTNEAELSQPAEGEAEAIIHPEMRALAQSDLEVATSVEVEQDDAGQSLLRRVLVLQKISLFSQLSQADLLQLARMAEEIHYEAGESVCKVNEYGDSLYGIIEGRVRVHRDRESIAMLEEGECFGEMALIDSGPRSADCTAAAPTLLLRLEREQILRLCFENMDFLRSLMSVLAERLKGMK